MSKRSDPKAQYVDISYGWQNRDEDARLQTRQRRRWWIMIVGVAVLAVLVFWLRWVN